MNPNDYTDEEILKAAQECNKIKGCKGTIPRHVAYFNALRVKRFRAFLAALPQAESMETLQDWTLPAPPPGRRWHREDWKSEWLEGGFRPLLAGEIVKPGDEVWSFGKGPWTPVALVTKKPARSKHHFLRTRRPLPAPSAEPEQAKPTQDELLAEAMKRPGVPDVEKAYGQQAKPAEKPCGFNSALDEWPADDGHGPATKEAPTTFTAHGKTWTRHTPGDPMPCDGEARVNHIMKVDWPTCATIKTIAGRLRWTASGGSSDIIGWRYADEPAQAKAIPTEPEDKRLPPLNEADPVGHCAVEAACVHHKLDELGVPREEGGDELSLWGRVEEYAASKAEPEPAQPWTPAPGDVVRLKSGGPRMTVEEVEGEGVGCVFATPAYFARRLFPITSLTPAKEGQP